MHKLQNCGEEEGAGKKKEEGKKIKQRSKTLLQQFSYENKFYNKPMLTKEGKAEVATSRTVKSHRFLTKHTQM